ncbi:MAG: helix-turn-helix transcriptional regulator [Chitinophagaceae bacterium]|nr:helix-turn-helix transcriptional regulator [Chitinophagaceae bacterium]
MLQDIVFNSVSEYAKAMNQDAQHPLICVIDYSKAPLSSGGVRLHIGLYEIILKEVKCGDLLYGKQPYDYQEGTLVFFAPGQVVEIPQRETPIKPKGYGVIFHPDLLHGTYLNKKIHEYSFFGYQTREALHLSQREQQTIIKSFLALKEELENSIDRHSKRLIVSHLELILNYCMRFYDRQFITREKPNKALLARFEELLNDYFHSGKAAAEGLPGVAYFAGQLHLSPNYFGDLIRKYTGRTAQEYIHEKLLLLAKDKLYDYSKSVSEVAFELGFKYPQHFTRFFRQKTGVSPLEYRRMN